MKTFLKIALIIFLFSLAFSCRIDDAEKIEFYRLKDRIGKWVNEDRGDTLDFINDTILIRYYGGKHDYLYRIFNNSMYVRLPDSQMETRHNILESNGDRIKLSNMYIGIEETINYAIFFKID
jgi:hypothetical protein